MQVFKSSLIFNIIMFQIAVFAFAYLTSEIITSVMTADPTSVAFQNKNSALLAFMADTRVDHEVSF